MNKKLLTKLSIGLGALVLVVAGLTAVKAKAQSAGFWDTVAQIAGQVLGNRIQIPDNFSPSEESLGASGDTESTARIAQVQFTGLDLTFTNGPDTASSTLFSLYNSSSRDRVIHGASLFLNGNYLPAGATTTARSFLRVATSTGSTFKQSSTNYVWNNTLSTSTIPSYEATTTPAQLANGNRIWGTGTYLVGSVNVIATSTPGATGYFRVDYSNLNP